MRFVIIQVAGLGHELVTQYGDLFQKLPHPFRRISPSFPAVTCSAQAAFRTGLPCEEHGMVANGVFFREAAKVEFWNQSSGLIHGERLWREAQQSGQSIGLMFWQQSLGEDVSLLLSPAPIHKHHGGMIQDCYSKPNGLYQRLCERLGRKFNLMNYWGPMASKKSSEWICDATCAVLNDSNLRPDILMTYLPHLDYILQKRGPSPDGKLRKHVSETVAMLSRLLDTAKTQGYEVLIWGDYAITEARKAVFPNLALKNAGLFLERRVGNRSYPDLYASRAIAVADHQVAHVYIRGEEDIPEVRKTLQRLNGVEMVLDKPENAHANYGELCLVAEENAWFAYPWWGTDENVKPPDFATHVDIHNKPGFDPCELFWGRLFPPGISLDCSRVKGTHGRTNHPVSYTSTLPIPSDPACIEDLARIVLTQLAVE